MLKANFTIFCSPPETLNLLLYINLQEALGGEPYVLMLVGAKVDMNDRKVEEEEGQKLAKVLILKCIKWSIKCLYSTYQLPATYEFSPVKFLGYNNIYKY